LDKVRFGIIGMGDLGLIHAQSLLANRINRGVLTAAYDLYPIKTDKLREFDPEKTVRIFKSSALLFKSGEVDAVLITVPNYLRPDLAIEALGYNLNVMVELPAGVYTKQVREMNEVAEETGSVFGIMYPFRANSGFIKMRDMVINGEIGEIMRTNWNVATTKTPAGTTWKYDGGGILINHFSGSLDLWQWICGMPYKVTAFCREGKWNACKVEDDVTAYVEYENGATGIFTASSSSAPAADRFEITGTLGRLVYENGRLEFFRFPEGLEKPELQSSLEQVLVGTGSAAANPKRILESFINKILNIQAPFYSGQDAINSTMLANAMYLSTWLGKTITLPLDEELFLSRLRKKI